MCKIKGIRTLCACRDRRCAERRDFVDWTQEEGVAMTQRGHGWQYFINEIFELCRQAQWLIDAGVMFWADEERRMVVTFVPHSGTEVDWEYRTVNDNGQGVLCDRCRTEGHRVA